MRMWHYRLIPYLPDLQLKGQLRELVAIMHNWRDKGTPKHMLVNNITKYPINYFFNYYCWYRFFYERRFGKSFNEKYNVEFHEFCNMVIGYKLYEYNGMPPIPDIYQSWHNKEYLRVCMANLYEKYKFATDSKSKISEEDWKRLCLGYKNITGEDYEI